jgi:hypothetical protein
VYFFLFFMSILQLSVKYCIVKEVQSQFDEEFRTLTNTISSSPIQYNMLPISFIPRRTSALSSDFVPQLSCSFTSLIQPVCGELNSQTRKGETESKKMGAETVRI